MVLDWSWCGLSGESQGRRVPTAPRRLVQAEPSWRVPASAVSPAAAFGAMALGGLTRHDSRRRLSKIIQWLKQAGERVRGVCKGGSYASRLKFRKQMVLTDRSGRRRTQELDSEEEALRNDWTIETNLGGRRTAISRMDHMTGEAKIRKQMVWNDWLCQISTQKIEVETSKNNSAFEIDKGGHRGK